MQRKIIGYTAIGIFSVVAPMLFPNYQTQLAFLWVMVVFALTWDIVGGQMGYNSFGNILFFGIGMYVTAIVQRDLFFDANEFVEIAGSEESLLSPAEYLTGLGLGMGASVIVCLAIAIVLGAGILGMRGHYFAICTLGLGIAAGEIFSGISYVGAGSGLVTPVFPEAMGNRSTFYYYMFFAIAVIVFFVLKFLYSSRFGLALNAIRDNEDKAEAMGLYTTRYKIMAWSIAAVFLGLIGGGVGNLIGFIDPIDVAFAGTTFGVWMILMAILGGKGTLWGPVIGAVVFHITQELFWTYLLGWQRVALGLLIVVIVVFFPQGIMGYFRKQYPAWFSKATEISETSASKQDTA